MAYQNQNTINIHTVLSDLQGLDGCTRRVDLESCISKVTDNQRGQKVNLSVYLTHFILRLVMSALRVALRVTNHLTSIVNPDEPF